MPEQTVGQLLVDQALPEAMRGRGRVLDKKGMRELLTEVARDHPESYRETSRALAEIGWRASQEKGGFSFGLAHLRTSNAALGARAAIRPRVQALLDDDSLDDRRREEEIMKVVDKYHQSQPDDVLREATASRNPLAMQVQSGARGNKMNLSSLLGSDMIYLDHHDDMVPIPVLSNYSEGLKPWEYWAGSYGARKGVTDVKQGVRDAGALGKTMGQVAHRLVVQGLDDPNPPRPGDAPRGVPVNVDEPDNEGALLAADAGPYKRNAVLTPKVMNHLKQLGKHRVLIRSPMAGGPPEGGVYARDAGVREKGGLPGSGEFVGLAATQSLAEPLSQGSLSSKHSGGVAGASKAVSGFRYINSLVNPPEHFEGRAALSDEDGTVTKITPAPAGGTYVHVNGKEHFAALGSRVTAKVGDTVEAGDALSEGLPDPAKITRLKGIGEGRRYFAEVFHKGMLGSNMPVHRRNVELLSRGLIDHVKLTDEMGDYAPGDVVPYHLVEAAYKPREGARKSTPAAAVGKYMERPALHYTIGTRVRPSVRKDLDEFGVKEVTVHDEPPAFEPTMIHGEYSLRHDPDWMTRMYGSGLKKSLLTSAHRGAMSDESGTSFVPSAARGVNFGRTDLIHSSDPPFPVKMGANPIFGGSLVGGGNWNPSMPELPKSAPAATAPRIVPIPNAPLGGAAKAVPIPNAPLGGPAGIEPLPNAPLGPTAAPKAPVTPAPAPPAPPAVPAATQPAATQPAPEAPPAGFGGYLSNWAKRVTTAPINAAAPVRDVGDRAQLATLAGGSLLSLAKAVVPRAAPFIAPVQQGVRRVSQTLMPSLVHAAPGAGRLGRFGAGVGNLFAAKTVFDTVTGAADAYTAGAKQQPWYRTALNPTGTLIRGYDTTSERMSQPTPEPDPAAAVRGDTPAFSGADLSAGLHNQTSDLITGGAALAKYMRRMNDADPGFRRDVARTLIGASPAISATAGAADRLGLLPAGLGGGPQQHGFDQVGDTAGDAARLTGSLRAKWPGATSFAYTVDGSGAQRLIHTPTGMAVNNVDSLLKTDQATRDQVLAALRRELPQRYAQFTGGQ